MQIYGIQTVLYQGRIFLHGIILNQKAVSPDHLVAQIVQLPEGSGLFYLDGEPAGTGVDMHRVHRAFLHGFPKQSVQDKEKVFAVSEGVLASGFDAVLIESVMQLKSCLLYTSRCV